MNQRIAALTKDCSSEECRISFEGGVTTTMAWYPTYDKRGNQIAADPNTTTSFASCSTCRKSWSISSRAGRDDVIAER